MLMLARRPGEAVLINGNIRLTARIRGGQILFGFEAPPGVSIVREEIYKKNHIHKEKSNDN